MNSENLQPNPVRVAQDEARSALTESAGHADALNSLAQGSSDRTPEDEAVLREWAQEGHGLQNDASAKAREASLLANSVREANGNPSPVKVTVRGEVLTDADIAEEARVREVQGHAYQR